MGRPLSKKWFGSPAQPGKHIVMTSAWVPGEVGPAEDFYVVRQVGTGRYQVTNGVATGVVRLVDAGPLSAGEAHLVINPAGDDNADEYARVINSRTVKTWEGHIYTWDANSGIQPGSANIFDGATPAPVMSPPIPTPAPPAPPAGDDGSV